ncbi:acireductone synthase [Corynebacterium comes]|uniref:Enolase-phosphatase E1 n=1 Tax=Corynebacterium comes TaxID=2675218 RepID=A0A6B8VYD4_9CORY|nr:acireductone synthase [Corynebacterium comes]QGU04727.1 Enolase-phosphatase E1 [Corynebacterium comes]
MSNPDTTVTLPRPDVIVLDIEGTTSSTWFVHDTLYPYSRERFGTWLREHGDNPDVARARTQIIEEGGLGAHVNVDTLVEQLEEWLDNDEKRTPLKTLQGLIWADGFHRGDLTSHFFPDSIPAIRRWHEEGIDLKIFSSGSVNAQTSWFGNSPEGDLLPMFSGHFDTENAGPKKLSSSYAAIRDVIGVPADGLLFFSDLVEELDGARTDGWGTVGVSREGDQYHDRGVGDHPRISSFDQVVWG